MKKHLIFAGGGHSHIYSLARLDAFVKGGWTVTVVNRSEFHYYSGMGPGLLSGYYTADETRFNVKKIVESLGCIFIRADVVQILPDEKRIILSDGTVLNYNLISFNTGSEVIPLPQSGNVKNLYPVKPVENISLIRNKILSADKKLKIAVIGGGAAGVEVASNIYELVSKSKSDADISIISRDHFLPGYTEPFYDKALRSLERKAIKIYEYKDVEIVDSENIHLKSGEIIKYDLAVNASGIIPSPLFTSSKMKTGMDGGLLVNRYLQAIDYPDIFAGGDCISFEPVYLNKVGVYAVRQGMHLYRNILSYLNGVELEEFKPQKSYLSILNIGSNKGIMLWKGIVIKGAIPFYFKYFLDSRFMKKYRKIRGGGNSKFIVFILMLLISITASADSTIHLGFNNLGEWDPLNFPKIKSHSTYSIVKENGRNILQCESNASASGLIYKKTFSIYNYTKLKWRWKVSNVYNNADPLKKSGDDFPIRIYIIFKYNPDTATLYEKTKYNAAKLIYGEYPPHSSVNYVWSSKVISEGVITSPYTDRVKLILLQKGGEKINTWITEEVNILQDYKKVFGENPPETASLAIMCDSDNTGESSKAFIEYIEVK